MPSNEHGQPVGFDLSGWTSPAVPEPRVLSGRTVEVSPLDLDRDVGPLFAALSTAPESIWTYMAFGPFPDASDLADTFRRMCDDPSWQPYTIRVAGSPAGFASYLRIQPTDGVIEIGAITLSPAMQRTTAATEALYLMIRNVFDQGYRRCEWKSDDLNEASRVAAERLGFRYEGTFAQATHYKGRNRDTAWYAIIDREWPTLDDAFTRWLDPENFDDQGRQRASLKEMREQ
ncbi:MAG TPA: GNAT family protein [Acidimicrobiia bacterium]